ncbi:MAG TPA: HAD family phosphatase [Candidatus Saccharimonadales bacterium]|nr:HAD family phosphatase [Candidatus Saccharimonadales bacterium]
MLQLPDIALPPTVEIEGIEFEAKTELHCSLLCTQKLAENFQDKLAADERLTSFVERYVQRNQLQFSGFTNKAYSCECEGARSIVIGSKVEGIGELFAALRREFVELKDLPAPALHATLYKYNHRYGIGIQNEAELQELCHPISSEILPAEIKEGFMSKFKTVLFDWEGVIGPQDTDSFGWLRRKLSREYSVDDEQAYKALGQNIGDFMVGGIDNATFWQRMGENLGVTFPKEFQDTIWSEWHGATPIPEMEKLVHEVKTMGLRTVVFSNIIPPGAAGIREIAGYEGFDAEVLSCEVGMKKPDVDIYKAALGAAECRPEECIFIDDKEKNLVPARELGMVTILAKNTDQIREDLHRLLS